MFKKLSLFVLNLILHSLAIGVIAYTFLPIAKWYMGSKPLWGIDFFLSINIASLITQHNVMPFAIWNYSGFSGWPQFLYPVLSAYFISFLAKYYDLIASAQIMVMASTFLFISGSYFLFFRVSKNSVIGAIFAVFVGLSGGVYQTLTWSGSLPSYTSQFALPWVLGFFVWFLRSGNIRLLFLSSLIAGISIWIHPLVYLTYILPSCAFLNFFTFNKGLEILKKTRNFSIFILISLIIGFPQFYLAIGSFLKSVIKSDYTRQALSTTTSISSETLVDINNFNKLQVERLISDNNHGLFLILPLVLLLFFLTLIVSRRISSLIKILPYFLVLAYFTFYVWLFGQGISIYHGGWYRLFWAMPVWVGLVGSALWYESLNNLKGIIKNNYLRLFFLTFSAGIFIFLGISMYFAYPVRSAIDSIIYRSEVSSAYPDLLNMKLSNNERNNLKSKLIPKWMNGDDTNFRLYDADQTVNIWWNSFFKMPLARGYIDPPIDVKNRAFLFLLDSSLSETDGEPQLVKAFKYPLETATSNALFLIDWNAIRYFEGPHVNSVMKPFPQYLKQTLEKKEGTVDLNEAKYTKRPVTLNYLELKDEFYSPILSGTNSSTLGIFSSEVGYETVVRAIAERNNLNSQKMIPIKLGKFIDKISLSELKNFDGLYLYDYSYKNQGKAFKILRSYLESGKKVFVETGTEVKETDGTLPDDIFPVTSVTRKGLGRDWKLESVDSNLLKNVTLGNFSPPLFDDAEWNFSYAKSDDVKNGANVILKNQDKVIMASQRVGQGELIWGGMNLAYHLTRNHNGDESTLFQNILSQMINLEKKPLLFSKVRFINPNERLIETEGAKGILFKEQAYDGWSAKVVGEKNKDLKIFKAGPTYPGFMYMPLPDSSKAIVNLKFSGSFSNKILIFVSLFAALVILDEVLIYGRVLGKVRRLVWKHFRIKVGNWWEKEE